MPSDKGQNHGICTVHEVVVYDGQLNDSEMMQVFNVLKSKWL